MNQTMKLSSFTQYYIRKLLRQYFKSNNSRIPCRTEIQRYFETDLNIILNDSGKTIPEILATTKKIETLVQAHHEQDISGLYDRQNLFQLEQQIFELVGLKLYSFSPITLLIHLEEKTIPRFYFVLNNKLHEGVRYKKAMYGLVLESRCGYELTMFQLIAVLVEREIPFIITNSKSRHAIWVNLKSPAYLTLLNYGSRLVDKALLLHNRLQKAKHR